MDALWERTAANGLTLRVSLTLTPKGNAALLEISGGDAPERRLVLSCAERAVEVGELLLEDWGGEAS